MLETSSRFLKKAAQKLFLYWSREFQTPVAQNQKSLFALPLLLTLDKGF